jgi:RNA polymerase sigma-70 factor (ECF subfamily)
VRPIDDKLRLLVRSAAAGDDRAFTALVEALHETLFRWALVRVGDPDSADDLVQQTLVRAHRGLRQYRGESSVATWMFRILARVTSDTIRKDVRRRELLESAAAETDNMEINAHLDPANSNHNADAVRRISVLLEELPLRQREIFNLVDLEGISLHEVSHMLSMKPVTVRANLFKARRALRTRLLAEGFKGRLEA